MKPQAEARRLSRAESPSTAGVRPMFVHGWSATGEWVEFQMRTWSEANQRGHWAVQRRRRGPQRMATRAFCMQMKRPTLPCTVKLVRIGRGQLDDDNLRGALKHVRDGVADWLGVDDADPRIDWQYAQERASLYRVRVEVSK